MVEKRLLGGLGRGKKNTDIHMYLLAKMEHLLQQAKNESNCQFIYGTLPQGLHVAVGLANNGTETNR